jgi:hypothetical protein
MNSIPLRFNYSYYIWKIADYELNYYVKKKYFFFRLHAFFSHISNEERDKYKIN